MKKFEYLTRPATILTPSEYEELDELGADGWELVLCDALYGNAVFKRELEENSCNSNVLQQAKQPTEQNEYCDEITIATDFAYSDSFLTLKYKGVDDVSNLFFGNGVQIKFLIENTSVYTLRVTAKNIAINGFVVSSSELIIGELGPHKKAIDTISLYRNLEDCEVTSALDIDTIEFSVEYEAKEINKEFESSCEVSIYT